MPLLVLIPTLKLQDLLNVIGDMLNPPLNSPLLQILPCICPCLLSRLAAC